MRLVTRLIRLSDYRKPVAIPAVVAAPNDGDLVPVSILLWIASVVRVALGVVERETFRTEATLALACVIVIPLWLISRTQRSKRAAAPEPKPTWVVRRARPKIRRFGG
jgi:hypothetical protein